MQSAPASGQKMTQLVHNDQQVEDEKDLKNREDDTEDGQNHKLRIT
jgi:hypothetical protein